MWLETVGWGMGFEEFEKPKPNRIDEPVATFRPSNAKLAFNTNAQEMFPDTDFVTYLVDSKEKEIALKPSDESNPGAYKATRTKYQCMVSVGKVMSEVFGFSAYVVNESIRCPVRKEDGLLVIDVGPVVEQAGEA